MNEYFIIRFIGLCTGLCGYGASEADQGFQGVSVMYMYV